MINNGTAPIRADFPNADADEIKYKNDPLGLDSLREGTSWWLSGPRNATISASR